MKPTHKHLADLKGSPNNYLLVVAKCCSRCLYSKNPLVDADTVRRLDKESTATGSQFICHTATYTDVERLRRDPRNLQVGCRRFFEKHPDQPLYAIAREMDSDHPEIPDHNSYFIDLDTGLLTPIEWPSS